MQHVDPAVIHAAAARGDHVYPYAEFRPLPEAATQSAINPWNFILHTMGGEKSASAAGLYKFISSPGQNGEPHLLFGYADLIQAVPFNVRADNNAKANRWFADGEWRGAISVETQDDGTLKDPAITKAPWNRFQFEHLAGVAAFLNLRYGVPLRRCSTWDSRGVDGHRACKEWSIYAGKSCPGETRWNQIPGVLLLAVEIAAWRPLPEGDVMEFVKVELDPAVPGDPGTLFAVQGALAWHVSAQQWIAFGTPAPAKTLKRAECARFTFVGNVPNGFHGIWAQDGHR